MSINQRIKIIIDTFEEGVNSRFAKKIGTAPTVVGTFLPGNRGSKPGFDLLVKILEAYPQLSTNWLLFGEGEMLENPGTKSATQPGSLHHYVGTSSNKISVGGVPTNPESSEIDYYRQRIRELEQKNSELLDKIMQLLTKKE